VGIEWSGHAVSDLKSISKYIERDRDLETANRISKKIYDAIQTLRSIVAVMDGLRIHANW
jgi:plasmid stabilization system protein ParE